MPGKVSKCCCKVLLCNWMSASNANFYNQTKNVEPLSFVLCVLDAVKNPFAGG